MEQQDILTVDMVGELDSAWMNAGQPANGLRMVPGKTMTVLTIPNDESAPVYRYRSHDPKTGKFAQVWQHIAGPTLAEWQAKRDAAELEGVLQAEYRDDYETRRDALDRAVQ